MQPSSEKSQPPTETAPEPESWIFWFLDSSLLGHCTELADIGSQDVSFTVGRLSSATVCFAGVGEPAEVPVELTFPSGRQATVPARVERTQIFWHLDAPHDGATLNEVGTYRFRIRTAALTHDPPSPAPGSTTPAPKPWRPRPMVTTSGTFEVVWAQTPVLLVLADHTGILGGMPPGAVAYLLPSGPPDERQPSSIPPDATPVRVDAHGEARLDKRLLAGYRPGFNYDVWTQKDQS